MIAEAEVGKAAGENLLRRWEARLKVPALMLMIFSFAFVRDLRLLPFLVLVAAITYAISGLPIKQLIRGVRLPGFFLLAMAVILPFWSGPTVLWQFGPLALRLEGMLGMLLIAGKFVGILTVVIVLFGTTPLSELVVALRSMAIPWVLTDLLLFTHRYLFQLTEDLQKMRTAARLRGFMGNSLSSLKPLAYITGSMLVRSHEQSEKVFQAMILRGYSDGSMRLPPFRPALSDYMLSSAALLLAAVFIFAPYIF